MRCCILDSVFKCLLKLVIFYLFRRAYISEKKSGGSTIINFETFNICVESEKLECFAVEKL